MKDDFYIGWSNEAPKSYAKKARYFFITAVLGLLAVAILFVTNQQTYNSSLFEFGTLSEVEGVLVDKPAWGIRAEIEGETKTIFFVGFGKSGPDQSLIKMRKNHGLEVGDEVIMRGTLFHFQGKYGMELTELEKSFVSSTKRAIMTAPPEELGQMTLQGEIVDPKCFFGVMNPATKAVHRSCAIRCISGGITPVLAIRFKGEFVDYYFIDGFTPENLEKMILPFVGLPVEVSGLASQYDDWKSIKVNGAGITLISNNPLDESIALNISSCN